MPQSSAASSEHVIEDDPRTQLQLSVPRYKPGELKYEFQMSSFATTILNLLYTGANVLTIRTLDGFAGKAKASTLAAEGQDSTFFGCTLDLDQTVQAQTKLSLDWKFNPWDKAITFRPEWRSMSKTVFTQYDPFETWYTCQSDVWLEDVKTFCARPMRCVIVVHPYPHAEEDTTPLTDSAYPSCAKICIDDSRFSPDLHEDKRVTLNKRETEERQIQQAFITETNQAMWSLPTNIIPHGRTVMYMVTPATEASMMAVGHFSKIFDPRKERTAFD